METCQGSVLGPLLFLLYINDLIDGMKYDARIFADDTSLFVVVDDPQATFEIMKSWSETGWGLDQTMAYVFQSWTV